MGGFFMEENFCRGGVKFSGKLFRGVFSLERRPLFLFSKNCRNNPECTFWVPAGTL
jgi:hypothetical protein